MLTLSIRIDKVPVKTMSRPVSGKYRYLPPKVAKHWPNNKEKQIDNDRWGRHIKAIKLVEC